MTAIDVLLFDLDGTLYPTSNGYVTHVRKNLYEYMEKTLQIPEAEKAWLPLFQKYNQTLRGLKCSGYDVNVDEYWATTRKGAEGFIAAAPAELVELLRVLPQKKYILTNCNELEAKVSNITNTWSNTFAAFSLACD
jgi:putative hydrolase of the HAD superfamily